MNLILRLDIIRSIKCHFRYWLLLSILLPSDAFGGNLKVGKIDNINTLEHSILTQKSIAYISPNLNVIDTIGVCDACPKIIEFQFIPNTEKLKITYGDEITKKPLEILEFDYIVRYELRDEYGQVVYKHSSSKTSLILNLEEIDKSGVYYLGIRPGQKGFMNFRIFKK